MPIANAIVHEDLADVLTPILSRALRAVPLPDTLMAESLSRYLATALGPHLEWAAFAGTLEATRPTVADPSETAERLEEGMTAFCLALWAGPPANADEPLAPARRPASASVP